MCACARRTLSREEIEDTLRRAEDLGVRLAPASRDVFSLLDRDGNGTVSWKEFLAVRARGRAGGWAGGWRCLTCGGGGQGCSGDLTDSDGAPVPALAWEELQPGEARARSDALFAEAAEANDRYA